MNLHLNSVRREANSLLLELDKLENVHYISDFSGSLKEQNAMYGL